MPSISLGLTDEQYLWLVKKGQGNKKVQDVIREIIDKEMKTNEQE